MGSSNLIELADLLRPARQMVHNGQYLSAAQIAEAQQHRRFLTPSTNGYNVNVRPSISPFKMLAIAGGSSNALSDMSGSASKAQYIAALQQANQDQQAAVAQAQADAEAARAALQLQQQQTAAQADALVARAQQQLAQQAQAQRSAMAAQQAQLDQQNSIRQASLAQQERMNQANFDKQQQQLQQQMQDQLVAQKTWDVQRDASRWQQNQQDALLASSQQTQHLQDTLSKLQNTVAVAPPAPLTISTGMVGGGAPLPPEMPSAPAPWSLPAAPAYNNDNSGAGSGDNINWAPPPSWELPEGVDGGASGAATVQGFQTADDASGMSGYFGDIATAPLPSRSNTMRNVMALSLGTIAVLAIYNWVK